MITNTAAEPPRPGLELLTRFTVDLVDPPWELGRTTPQGDRRIIPITGGSFAGPLLNGHILNHGADWQIVTTDSTTIVDTRYLLQMHDGALVYLQTKGYRHGPAEVMAKLAAGLIVDPASYYFRITLSFETADRRYGWLNWTVAAGSAVRLPNAVVYDAYRIT